MKITLGAILFLILFLFGTLFFSLSRATLRKDTDLFLQPDTIRGSSVFYAGQTYTLNFLQQEELVSLLNDSVFSEKLHSPYRSDFEKIEIYFFDGRMMVLEPLQEDFSLFSVFSTEERSLAINQPKALKTLLETTYDKK